MVAPGRGVLRIAALFGQWDKVVQRCANKPAEPYAFALAAFADAVHAIVPVACTHERQTMGAGGRTGIERQSTMRKKACLDVGNHRLEEGVALTFVQHWPL